MVIVLVGQLAGAFSGSWIAAKIGRSRVPAYVIGGLLLVLGIVSALVVPQPVWYLVTEFAIYIGAAIAGARLARPAVRSSAG